MAPSSKKTQKSSKAKKKLWFSVTSPPVFNSISLGETAAFDAEELPGRAIKVNLMSLTNDPRSQHINLTFKINKVTGTQAHTEVYKYEINPSHIKRLVRRNRERIDHSFLCKSKEGKTVRIKFLIITRNKATNSVNSELRRQATTLFAQNLALTSLDHFFKDAIFSKIQKSIKSALAKVTPLRNVEIKVIKTDENKKRQPLVVPPKIEEKPQASHQTQVPPPKTKKEESKEPSSTPPVAPLAPPIEAKK